MWFFVVKNFELKLETLILLDKIQTSRFTEKDLSDFIVFIESEMVREMNSGGGGPKLDSSVWVDQPSDSGEFDAKGGRHSPGDRSTALEDSYQSLNFEKMGSFDKLAETYQEEGVDPHLDGGQFKLLSQEDKKQWVLAKIMQLDISAQTQNQLVDRLDLVMKGEEKERQEELQRRRLLETRLGQLEEDNSLTLQEEKLILNQLEEKERQLLSVEYDFRQTRERLGASEKEKKRLEEKFISEVLGLQTQLDQKLFQIKSLDQKNADLLESKRQFEQMIEEYKQYSQDCRKETGEVRAAKEREIGELRRELDWEKERSRADREAFLSKVEGEKIALEQTIRELIYKNKVE